MKKYIVETYYTCTFKTVHSLNDLNEKELAEVDTRTDGDVEVIDVKLNNRKTKIETIKVVRLSQIKMKTCYKKYFEKIVKIINFKIKI